MVCVGKGSADNLPRLIPAEVMFIHQKTHQFGNGDDGVCIIQLNHIVAREIRKVRTVLADK